MPLLTEEERVGTTLSGRYRLTALIGKGGMGSVFRGVHTRTQRLVAVKFLHPEFARNEEAVERFVREAQAAAALRHPNVIDIIDMDWDQGGFYLVMEFLEGEGLDQYVARVAPLAETDACAVLLPVMDALGRAHGMSIVHRDLKPDNILLSIDATGAMVPKLLDFGVAKLLAGKTQQTRTGALIGTPAYMSPEQVAGSEFVDARTDVWAMGVLWFECLTGAPPFSSDSPMNLCMRILAEDVPAVRERMPASLREAVSPRVTDAIDRALQKDPAERFPSMWEFMSAITGAPVDDALMGAVPVQAPQRWSPSPSVVQARFALSRLSFSQAAAPVQSAAPPAWGSQTGASLPQGAGNDWPTRMGQTTFGDRSRYPANIPFLATKAAWSTPLASVQMEEVEVAEAPVEGMLVEGMGEDSSPPAAPGIGPGRDDSPTTMDGVVGALRSRPSDFLELDHRARQLGLAIVAVLGVVGILGVSWLTGDATLAALGRLNTADWAIAGLAPRAPTRLPALVVEASLPPELPMGALPPATGLGLELSQGKMVGDGAVGEGSSQQGAPKDWSEDDSLVSAKIGPAQPVRRLSEKRETEGRRSERIVREPRLLTEF